MDALDIAAGLGAAAAGAVLGAAAAKATRSLWDPPACDTISTEGGTLLGVRYIERMRGGAGPNDAVPMVVAFHSSGGTPNGYAGGFKGIGPARLILPAGEVRTGGGGYKWWPDGVRKAMEPENYPRAVEDWHRAARRMHAFLDELQRCRPTVGKPIVTGSSMGGEMAYLMASEYPRDYAMAVAVSGYLLPDFWNRRMAPTVGIHGSGDNTVPFKWAEEYAAQMIDDGAAFAWQPFTSSGHSTNAEMRQAWNAALHGATTSQPAPFA